jgi:transcriptional regulator CtsR
MEKNIINEEKNKIIEYSINLSIISRLFNKKILTEKEYEIIKKQIKNN